MLILIVEDDALIAMAAAASLADAGHDIAGPAGSYPEALLLLQRLFLTGSLPDPALVDIHLKGTDAGIRLARLVHSRWRIPVIFVTGEVEEARRNRDVALGVIGKPCSANALVACAAIAAKIIRGEVVDPRPGSFEHF
jgi:CheY-like chemotaxis protein